MKKNRNLLIALFFLIILYSTSCRPEGGPKAEEHYGPYYFREYANYFYFKPGTYWIYENNRTGEFDTCILSSIYRDTITFFGETADFKRWYTQEVINYNVFTRHRLGLNYMTTEPCLVCLYLDSTRAMKKNGSSNVFFIPWNKYANYAEYYPVYNINTSSYYKVFRFDVEMDDGLPFWDDTKLLWGGQNGASNHSSYFWAKDIGLIRIMYTKILDTGPDTAYWNLKEYNIQKF